METEKSESGIVTLLIKYNLSIFTVAMALGLGVTVYILFGILSTTFDDQQPTATTSTNSSVTQAVSFSEYSKTINGLNSLYTPEAIPDYSPSGTRVNPFSE